MDDTDLDFGEDSVYMDTITEYRVLRRGDQLAVAGKMHGRRYWHHGIFLGFDKGVAHFGADDSSSTLVHSSFESEGSSTSQIKLDDINKFTHDGDVLRHLARVWYEDGIALPAEEVAEKAESYLDNPSLWGEFNILTNNCEHFAMLCKTGRKVSLQVIEMLNELLPVLTVATTAGCLVLQHR